MTKADLVERVAEKTGLTRTDVAVVVDSFLDTVKKSLESGHNIEIRGFGTFKVKLRKARKARNPRTGEVVPVPDRDLLADHPGNSGHRGRHVPVREATPRVVSHRTQRRRHRTALHGSDRGRAVERPDLRHRVPEPCGL